MGAFGESDKAVFIRILLLLGVYGITCLIIGFLIGHYF